MISVNSLFIKRGDKLSFSITDSKWTNGTYYWHETYDLAIRATTTMGGFWNITIGTGYRGDATYEFDTSQIPAKFCGVNPITIVQVIHTDSWMGSAIGDIPQYAEFECSIGDEYKPKIECDDEITASGIKLENYILAGVSTSLLSHINITNAMADDDSYLQTVIKYQANGISGELAKWGGRQTNAQVKIPVLPASDNPYELVVQITTNDERNRQVSKEVRATVYPYHKPTKTSRTYVSRVNEHGVIDGRGYYGKVRYEWDISPVNNANSLVSYKAEVFEKNGTPLEIQPTAGSIEDGYFEYLFPASLTVDTVFQATLSDRVFTGIEDTLVLSSSAVPLSLFDAGEGVGVAVGREATEKGFWCFEAFYLKGTDINSGKIFQLMVNDNGDVSVKLIRDESTHSTTTIKADPIKNIFASSKAYDSNGYTYTPYVYVRVIQVGIEEEVLLDTTVSNTVEREIILENGRNYRIEFYLKVGSDKDWWHPKGTINDQYDNVLSTELSLSKMITSDGTYVAKLTGLYENYGTGYDEYSNFYNSTATLDMLGDFYSAENIITPTTCKIVDNTTGKNVAAALQFSNSSLGYFKLVAGHSYTITPIPMANTLKSGWTMTGTVERSTDGGSTYTKYNLPYTFTASTNTNYAFKTRVLVKGGRRLYLDGNKSEYYMNNGSLALRSALTKVYRGSGTGTAQMALDYTTAMNVHFQGGTLFQPRVGNFEKGKTYTFAAEWSNDGSAVTNGEWYVNDVATGVKTATFSYTVPNTSDETPIKITIK